MRKFRPLIILLLTASPFFMNAQGNELKAGLRAGHNTAFGGFAAVSLETVQTFCENISINGGLQYNTIGKAAIEACPAYNFPFEWGKLSFESLFTYSKLSSINNFTAGAGTKLDSKHVGIRLGYYYRLYYGPGSRITEPFNIYYELRVHFLKKIEDWSLDLAITNCEIFELERHFQPSFIAEGSYFPSSKFGISLGIGCKPSGMFNMSADYYQSFLKTGVCYRWQNE